MTVSQLSSATSSSLPITASPASVLTVAPPPTSVFASPSTPQTPPKPIDPSRVEPILMDLLQTPTRRGQSAPVPSDPTVAAAPSTPVRDCYVPSVDPNDNGVAIAPPVDKYATAKKVLSAIGVVLGLVALSISAACSFGVTLLAVTGVLITAISAVALYSLCGNSRRDLEQALISGDVGIHRRGDEESNRRQQLEREHAIVSHLPSYSPNAIAMQYAPTATSLAAALSSTAGSESSSAAAIAAPPSGTDRSDNSGSAGISIGPVIARSASLQTSIASPPSDLLLVSDSSGNSVVSVGPVIARSASLQTSAESSSATATAAIAAAAAASTTSTTTTATTTTTAAVAS